jgi:hypothetical protein
MLSLLLVALAAPVYASYATSIMYTKFNLPNAWQDIALDQTYNHLTADIKVYLDFNVTGTWAKIYFANDTSGSSEGINLLFGDDGVTLKVYYVQEPSEVLIGTGTYTLTGNVSTTRVVFSGSKLDVYTHYENRTLRTKIVDGFSLSTPIANIRARGTSTWTVENGYVQVNVNVGASGLSGSTTDIVMSFLPVIVTFAMLGMVFGMLKKFGKI